MSAHAGQKRRLDWRDGLGITSLSAGAFAALGLVPILTWIIAASAPWELLAFGIAMAVLGTAGMTVGGLAMRRDKVTL